MNFIAVSLSVLLCVAVVEVCSNRTYSALNSIIFTNIPEPKDDVHSEYYFGKCATQEKNLILHDRLTYEQIKGQLIIRGHLNLTKETVPNCVYIKASSSHGDMVRYNAYKFTVCVVRIAIYYLGSIYNYYYYEWFVPVEMQKDIDWDLYFYVA